MYLFITVYVYIYVQELPEWQKFIEKIVKGEKRIARSQEIREALEQKVSRHRKPHLTLAIDYKGTKGKNFSDEEDIFLVYAMHRYVHDGWPHVVHTYIRTYVCRKDFFRHKNSHHIHIRTHVDIDVCIEKVFCA